MAPRFVAFTGNHVGLAAWRQKQRKVAAILAFLFGLYTPNPHSTIRCRKWEPRLASGLTATQQPRGSGFEPRRGSLYFLQFFAFLSKVSSLRSCAQGLGLF